jgi:phage-related protein
MAFKMKGSPHKMGGIQGASGHASALKQGSDKLKQARADYLKYTELKNKAQKDEVNYTTRDYVNYRDLANEAAERMRNEKAKAKE